MAQVGFHTFSFIAISIEFSDPESLSKMHLGPNRSEHGFTRGILRESSQPPREGLAVRCPSRALSRESEWIVLSQVAVPDERNIYAAPGPNPGRLRQGWACCAAQLRQFQLP